MRVLNLSYKSWEKADLRVHIHHPLSRTLCLPELYFELAVSNEQVLDRDAGDCQRLMYSAHVHGILPLVSLVIR
jgi:hypothetical protein